MMGTYKFMMGTYKFMMGAYKFMMGTYKFMMGTYKFMMGTYKMQVMHKFVLVHLEVDTAAICFAGVKNCTDSLHTFSRAFYPNLGP
jgi:hypothetical protein